MTHPGKLLERMQKMGNMFLAGKALESCLKIQ
jgi:hypothetical protein